MAAVYYILDLIAGDDPADDCVLPVIIRGNQSSRAVIQFQCRISQYIRNTILRELRANRANNYFLWFGPLNNEAANLYVVACLNKGTGRNVSESRNGAHFHCSKAASKLRKNMRGAAHWTSIYARRLRN